MYNLECWVYGADPVGNADLVSDGALPQDRAEGARTSTKSSVTHGVRC